MSKPTMVYNYDYPMEPFPERIPYSSAYQLEQSLKKHFNVYHRGEIENPDFAFNTLPKADQPFGADLVEGKVTSFWTTSPLEGIYKEYHDRCTVNFYSAPSLKDKFPPNSELLLDFLDPHYQFHPCQFEYDVGFLGNEYGVAAHRIDFLAGLEKHFKVLRGAAASLGEESAKLLSKCKLVISIQDYHDQGFGIERRIYTFGNVRPIMVHYNDDYNAVGKPFTHYIPYGSLEEAIELIKEYTGDIDKVTKREEIGQNLKDKLKSEHTVEHRAKQIYDTYLKKTS